MKIPKLSLKYLAFLIVSYLLSFLYIGNSTFSFTSLPSILYTLTGSNISGASLSFLVFLMTGVYKGSPQNLFARAIIATGAGLGVYLFGVANKKYENSNLAAVAITVVPSIITFFSIRAFYTYEAAMEMSKTVLIMLAINTFLALIIDKVSNMPNQKGVIAKWLKR